VNLQRGASRAGQMATTRRGVALILTLLVAAALLGWVLLEGGFGDVFLDTRAFVGSTVRHAGPIGSDAALYVEESGVPLPVPGDVFVMYAGHAASSSAAFLVAVWLGIVIAVVLGASNLYWVSKRWGRQLVNGRLGRIMHVGPAQLERAEKWFTRWGPWALIFGRHVFGLRIPLTVAAGIFRVRYRVFAASVAVSTGVWAAIFMAIGVALGGRVGKLVGAHRWTYLLAPVAVVALVVYFAVRVYQTRKPARA
jgi:membrane protein DedA with SNARE-associated domain